VPLRGSLSLLSQAGPRGFSGRRTDAVADVGGAGWAFGPGMATKGLRGFPGEGLGMEMPVCCDSWLVQWGLGVFPVNTGFLY